MCMLCGGVGWVRLIIIVKLASLSPAIILSVLHKNHPLDCTYTEREDDAADTNVMKVQAEIRREYTHCDMVESVPGAYGRQ